MKQVSLPTNKIKSLEELTEREKELVSWLFRGRSLRSSCEKLGISYNTGKSHIKNIYLKLGLSCRDELMDVVDKGRMLNEGEIKL